LSDAAHVPGGFSSGVMFPKTDAEVAAALVSARRVLPVGAQSSLTGGATPRGEVIVSTRALTGIAFLPGDIVRVGAGVPLSQLQRAAAARRLYYAPVPTFEGAFVGGTIATNAAGAATFKYGSTREWVEGIRVVLPDGSLIHVRRGAVTASPDGAFELEYTSGDVVRVSIPTYRMPAVPKLSAGYFARPDMDLIDLFIGSEGTLGIIVEAELRLVPQRPRCVVLLTCRSDEEAIAITAALRREALAAWRGDGPLDVAAIEYIDSRALAHLPTDAFVRAGVARPVPTSAFLLVQIEVSKDEGGAMQRLGEVLDACDADADPTVAIPGDERTARRLVELREAVPAAINALVAAAKVSVDPGIQKTAADFIVPFDKVGEALALYRAAFESCGVDYAIWGHLSDGNLHPNVIPYELKDVESGRRAILELATAVIGMGGAPLAEHGVGRSPLKQTLLKELYGENGINEMRAVKRALDPAGKLSPGVLFPEP
jgi:D-lactate dehydrogenase (cytochrome)